MLPHRSRLGGRWEGVGTTQLRGHGRAAGGMLVSGTKGRCSLGPAKERRPQQMKQGGVPRSWLSVYQSYLIRGKTQSIKNVAFHPVF